MSDDYLGSITSVCVYCHIIYLSMLGSRNSLGNLQARKTTLKPRNDLVVVASTDAALMTAYTGSSQHTQTFLKMSVDTITDLRRLQMANNSPEQTPRVCPISVESRVPSALTAPARSTVGQHAAPAGEFLYHTRAKRKLHAAAHWAAASSQ